MTGMSALSEKQIFYVILTGTRNSLPSLMHSGAHAFSLIS